VNRSVAQDPPGQAPPSAEPSPDLWADAPQGLRRAVQNQAPERLKRHGVRDALRFVGLLSVDGLAFLITRSVLHFLRVQGPLTAVRDIFPRSYLGGLQFAVALFVSLLVVGAYRRGGGWRSPWRSFMGVTLATALALWQPLWTQDLWLVSVQFAASVVAVSLTIVVLRGALSVGVGLARERFEAVPQAVLVGDSASIVEAARSEVFSQSPGYRIARELPIDGPGVNGDAIGAELASAILDTHADAVCVTGSLSDGLFKQVIEVAHSTGCELFSISRAWHVAGVLPLPRRCCGVHLTSLTQPGLKAHQLVIKRLIDIVASALGLIATLPLLVVLAIAVKTTSRGPVFFRQERVGRGGKRFMILKFRTMRLGADDEKASLAYLNHTGDSRLFKIPDDPRVTRVGAFLRRWSLDELPQLVNVFRGEMSLVGPRPFFHQDLDEYQDHHFLRLAARPGITGLWQVRGRSDISDFEEVVALDREYIDSWSSWLDLKILALTVPAVLRRHGAY
jgi:exopolysaccharide biosynthesis polyprenyl glycosylphosphotransferase